MRTLFYPLILVSVVAVAFIQSCTKEETQEEIDMNCTASVTDADGNVYLVLKIGSQCWMQENLKTSKYRDGTSIPTGLDATQWSKTTAGAFAIYNDNSANDATYGKLYNGHAVATGLLCPDGWHIPTDDEWKTLEKYLGLSEAEANQTGERSTDVGGKLKATTLWDAPNTAASNSSGFTALPAGTRNSVGDYIVLKQYTDFWTSTPYATDNNFLWERNLYYNGGGVGRIYQSKDKGYSCRCVKN